MTLYRSGHSGFRVRLLGCLRLRIRRGAVGGAYHVHAREFSSILHYYAIRQKTWNRTLIRVRRLPPSRCMEEQLWQTKRKVSKPMSTSSENRYLIAYSRRGDKIVRIHTIPPCCVREVASVLLDVGFQGPAHIQPSAHESPFTRRAGRVNLNRYQVSKFSVNKTSAPHMVFQRGGSTSI